MVLNTTPYLDCTFSDFNALPSNDTENSTEIDMGIMLHMYKCFQTQMTAKEKVTETYGKPLGIISLVVCCLSLIANFLAIVVITNMSSTKSMHLKLTTSLCLSDMLISFSILCDDFLYMFTEWNTCMRLCLRLFLDQAIFATLLNLLAMALDHFIGILKPIHYRQLMTAFQMNCTVIIIWIISLCAVAIEIIVGFSLTEDQNRGTTCEKMEKGSNKLEVFIIGFIFIVLIGIVCIYMTIYNRITTVMPQRQQSRCQMDSSSFKALITSVLFIVSFLLFWIPHGAYQIVLFIMTKVNEEHVIENIDKFTSINDILFLILQLNSLADPVIYAFRLPKVRRGCAALCFCRRKREKKVDSTMLSQTMHGSTCVLERKREVTFQEDTSSEETKRLVTSRL